MFDIYDITSAIGGPNESEREGGIRSWLGKRLAQKGNAADVSIEEEEGGMQS